MEKELIELKKRKIILKELQRKSPIITAQMRFRGLQSREQRREILRFKGEVERQKRKTSHQISIIENYIKRRKEFERMRAIPQEADHEGFIPPLPPRQPQLKKFSPYPTMRKMRRMGRR